MLGDRVGRRTALLSSVMAFAALTPRSLQLTASRCSVLRFLSRMGLRRADCRRARVRICATAKARLCGHAHHRVHPARRHAGRAVVGAGVADVRVAHAVRRRRHHPDRAGNCSVQGPAGISPVSRQPPGAMAGAHRDASKARTQRALRYVAHRGGDGESRREITRVDTRPVPPDFRLDARAVRRVLLCLLADYVRSSWFPSLERGLPAAFSSNAPAA